MAVVSDLSYLRILDKLARRWKSQTIGVSAGDVHPFRPVRLEMFRPSPASVIMKTMGQVCYEGYMSLALAKNKQLLVAWEMALYGERECWEAAAQAAAQAVENHRPECDKAINQYHLTGTKEALDGLFDVTREAPLILMSWPFQGDCKHGFIVRISPTLKHSHLILSALCKELGVTCSEYQEKVNCYDIAVRQRQFDNNKFGFTTTPSSEFAAGYQAALINAERYGLKRVQENATSGIPK